MGHWEYRIVNSNDVVRDRVFTAPDPQEARQTLEDHLNELGREGWELIAADFNPLGANRFSFMAIMKREG